MNEKSALSALWRIVVAFLLLAVLCVQVFTLRLLVRFMDRERFVLHDETAVEVAERHDRELFDLGRRVNALESESVD